MNRFFTAHVVGLKGRLDNICCLFGMDVSRDTFFLAGTARVCVSLRVTHKRLFTLNEAEKIVAKKIKGVHHHPGKTRLLVCQVFLCMLKLSDPPKQ